MAWAPSDIFGHAGDFVDFIIISQKHGVNLRSEPLKLFFLYRLIVSLCRHFNVAIWRFSFLLNGEETPFNLFENRGIVVDHTAFETNLNRSVGNQQIFAFVTIEVFDSAFLISAMVFQQQILPFLLLQLEQPHHSISH